MKKLFYGMIGVIVFMLLAIPNAKAETITLKAEDFEEAKANEDVLQDSGLTYVKSGTYEEYHLASGDYVLATNVTGDIIILDASVTLDISNYTVPFIYVGTEESSSSTLTLSGTGKVGNGGEEDGLFVDSGATATINGNITFDFIEVEEGKLTINNAIVSATEYEAVLVIDGSIVINGGTFTGVGAGLALVDYQSAVLSGGTFKATSAADGIKSAIVIAGTDKNVFNTILANGKAYSENINIISGEYNSTNVVYLTNDTISIVDISNSSSTEETKVTYDVLEGASQTFNTTSGKNLTFRFDVDYAKFEVNGKVYVDGNLVDTSNYTSKSGSTIIIFNKAYVKKLANGKHTLTVDFGDGTASTDFTITGNPNTGDNIYVYIVMFIASCLGITYFSKKKIND